METEEGTPNTEHRTLTPGFVSRIGASLGRLRFAQAAARSWVELTLEEQRAVMAILALFLLGMAVRVWHVHFRSPPASPAMPAAATSMTALTNSPTAVKDAPTADSRKPSRKREGKHLDPPGGDQTNAHERQGASAVTK